MPHGAMPQAHISWAIVTVLVVMLLMAMGMYAALVRRETTQRRRIALLEWAQRRAARVWRWPHAQVPPELVMLSPWGPEARVVIQSPYWSVVELTSSPPPQAPAQIARWRLVVHQIQGNWPTTALRPVTHRTSVADLLQLTSFPSLARTGRFVVFGTDSTAAKLLARGSAEMLLPPDIGMVLHGAAMVLDFSTRPFDTIEMGRMLALAEQLLRHLPAMAPAGRI